MVASEELLTSAIVSRADEQQKRISVQSEPYLTSFSANIIAIYRLPFTTLNPEATLAGTDSHAEKCAGDADQ